MKRRTFFGSLFAVIAAPFSVFKRPSKWISIWVLNGKVYEDGAETNKYDWVGAIKTDYDKQTICWWLKL